MTETDSNFLRRQAELCIALSRSTFDLTLAKRLRALADELRTKADEAEDAINGFPAHSYRGSSLRPGEKNRN